jgi:hypothetical protein
MHPVSSDLYWKSRASFLLRRPTICSRGNRAYLSKYRCGYPESIISLARRSLKVLPQASNGAATLVAVHDSATEADTKDFVERSDDDMSTRDTALLSGESISSEGRNGLSQPSNRGGQSGDKLEDGFGNGGNPEDASGSQVLAIRTRVVNSISKVVAEVKGTTWWEGVGRCHCPLIEHWCSIPAPYTSFELAFSELLAN